MLVTINTDASYHPKYRVGGFAFWVVSNSFRIYKSGPLRGSPQDSNDAEMRCIINALTATIGYVGITRIIVNTDSMNAIQIFTGVGKGWSPAPKHVVDHYKGLKRTMKRRGIKIEYRHVKAHSGKGDARSYVNEWCDTEAKKHMRNLVNTIKKIKH